MLELILSLIVAIIVIYGQGIIFNKLITNQVISIDNFNETFIFGIIFLSFITLLLNFFFPINKEIGSFLLLISFIFFAHNFAVSKSRAVAVAEIAPVLELTANKPASLPAVML